jgi:hypothetical protein
VLAIHFHHTKNGVAYVREKLNLVDKNVRRFVISRMRARVVDGAQRVAVYGDEIVRCDFVSFGITNV